MPRRTLRRILPSPHKVRSEPRLRIFGQLLHSADLWHLNRRSVSGAVAVGLFMAFVPVPFQMLLAAGAAILLSVNLPIAVALVWISNPFTMPPMFYGAYKVGAWLLNEKRQEFHFELSLDWLLTQLGAIWQPFLLGCAVCGALSAALGYSAARALWRMHVVQNWKERRRRRRAGQDV